MQLDLAFAPLAGVLLAAAVIELDAGVLVQLGIAAAGAVWMVATMRGETRRLRIEIGHLRVAVDHLAGRRLDERVTRVETLVEHAGIGAPLDRSSIDEKRIDADEELDADV